MIQRNLRLMIIIIAITATYRFTVDITISVIETSAIGTILVILDIVHGRALVVPLRSSKSCQWQFMMIVDYLRDISKVSPSFIIGTFHVTISRIQRPHECNSPSVVHQSGRERNRILAETIVTNTEISWSTFLGFGTFSNHIHGSSHRRNT